MAQKRYYEFDSDDDTFTLANHMVSLTPAGRYHGFDFTPTPDLTLRLSHEATGFRRATKDKTLTDKLGVLKTPQGILIEESEPVDIAGVAAGDAANPRKDLVICEHQYKPISGGEQALYKIIRGTPAVNPVAPTLQNEATQLAIGTLHVPAGVTALNVEGVTFTQSLFPMYGANAYLLERLALLEASVNARLKNSTDSMSGSLTVAGAVTGRDVLSERFFRTKNIDYDLVNANTSMTVTVDLGGESGIFLVSATLLGHSTAVHRTCLVNCGFKPNCASVYTLGPGMNQDQGEITFSTYQGRPAGQYIGGNSDGRKVDVTFQAGSKQCEPNVTFICLGWVREGF